MKALAKSVHLSEDVYALLTALKREGESYSDTVRRLASERRDPQALKELPPLADDFDLDEFRDEARQRDLDKLESLHGEDG